LPEELKLLDVPKEWEDLSSEATATEDDSDTSSE
jgi:hypothetical protein